MWFANIIINCHCYQRNVARSLYWCDYAPVYLHGQCYRSFGGASRRVYVDTAPRVVVRCPAATSYYYAAGNFAHRRVAYSAPRATIRVFRSGSAYGGRYHRYYRSYPHCDHTVSRARSVGRSGGAAIRFRHSGD